MNYKNSLRRLAGVVVAGTVLALAAGSALAQAHKGKKVILLGADDICEYCAVYNDAVRKFAKDAGIELELVTNKFDAAQQAAQVEQAIAKKPDAILLWTIDGTALFPAMRKVKAAGIPLLLTDVEPDMKMSDLWIQYTGGNYEGSGRLAAQLMVDAFKAKGLGTSGDIILITGIIGQAQTMSIDKGFREELKKLAPGIRIVGSQPGNWDTGTATEAATGLFTKYGKNIKGIYSHEDLMLQGALVAAERAGIDLKTLAAVGRGCEPAGIANIKAGRQYATTKQSPIDEARYAIDSVVNHFAGKKMEKSVYVPMPKVTAANVDQECQAWPKR
ncbi:MAG TPA: sugar ABC transporter substrate-binding protein [Burkholderiaceae bacterium]|nr:sugar ABC transporter substrate-binding protein [Burkholderiaceae bacterium]